jgi:hypothetical protein
MGPLVSASLGPVAGTLSAREGGHQEAFEVFDRPPLGRRSPDASLDHQRRELDHGPTIWTGGGACLA